MGDTDKRFLALPLGHCDAPTLGTVKAVLHQFSRSQADAVHGTSGANLRAAYELLLAQARRSGVDPDQALQRRHAAAGVRRLRVARTSADATRDPGR